MVCPLLILAWITHAANATVTITISPDDRGGTTLVFEQTADCPPVSTDTILGGEFVLSLPPSMFSPSILGTGATSEIFGVFPSWATFRDGGSGFDYDVVSLRIGADLSFAQLGFDREYSTLQDQSESDFVLLSEAPVDTTISPLAFVGGSHTTSSLLFGSVNVNVIPEPSLPVLLLCSVFSLALLRCRQMSETSGPAGR